MHVVVDLPRIGPISLLATGSAGPVTPASLACARAVALHGAALQGTGIDWGAGTGLLSIAAARCEGVQRIFALELEKAAVAAARINVEAADVADRVRVVHADSLRAFERSDAETLARLAGACDFLVANPPASDDGDGLNWRRRLLEDARPFLKLDALVLLQVSVHYGEQRIRALARDVAGYHYEECVESSDWLPFDLSRPDLRRSLDSYVAEEDRGGERYAFRMADGTVCSAREILEGAGDPLTRWQVHRLRARPV